ncbi:hypothetical protein SAMN05444339_10254 [Loktanella atrilutea]|uniref:Uncharacterized protein n=1 Tax=Loktanella atrilutea TaxID=366533 RepID=A0A1M4WB61_LOKAT|nr:hypothetical protein SAMN05444339_10254 [Loktanella atrilutea]
MPEATRQDDLILLSRLRRRTNGMTVAQIAFQDGVTPAGIFGQFKKVIADDIAMSGEPEGTVRRGYW